MFLTAADSLIFFIYVRIKQVDLMHLKGRNAVCLNKERNGEKIWVKNKRYGEKMGGKEKEINEHLITYGEIMQIHS